MTLVNADLTTTTYVLDNFASNSTSESSRELRITNKLETITDVAGTTAQFVTFIDIDEDGRLDFLIQDIKNGVPSLKLVYNNIDSDSFFIKALMLNSKQENSDNIYGDNSMGVSFRFIVTDLDDNKYVAVGT
jgi:hypothetical protein